MTRRPLISIVLPDLRSGGAERVNVDLAKGFADLGIDVDFVLREARGEFLQEAQTVGEIVSLKAPRVRHAIRPLCAYLKQRKPDAMLASMWPLTVAAVWARAREKAHCRTVLIEHGILSQQYAPRGHWHNRLMRLSLRYSTRRADAVTCVSIGSARDLADMTGQELGKFKVIHNPVPAPKPTIAADHARAEAMWSSGPGKRIVTVGRLKAIKNQKLLIEALAAMNDPEARLMIVGDGELRNELEQEAQRHQVANQVIFAGFQADPGPFYATADVFALSSHSEGFGNVIVEAMGHGLPVVSTDCPTGPREILDSGRFGRLVPMGDAGQMASALREALQAPVDRKKQIARAAEFAPEFAIKSYLHLLLPEQTFYPALN